MAKKGTAAPAANGKNGAAEHDEFIEVAAADFDAGWWDMEASEVIKGKLLGAWDMPDQFNKNGRRDYIQLKVLEPVEVVRGKDTFTAQKGDVVSVGVTARLQPILTDYVPLVRAGANVRLKLTSDGKKKTKDGTRSVWDITTAYSIVSGPTGPVTAFVKRNDAPTSAPASRGSAAPADDADVPF